ncbi:MAG: hypothetical protein ACRDZQ_05520, partial [Acidimicrobiales bacterium]
ASAGPAGGLSAGPAGGASDGTVAVLAERFPGLAALLPSHQAADAFWLSAWWAGRPSPPSWLPDRLLAEPARLAAAAQGALGDLTALAELADLDARIGPDTVLGDQVTASLDLARRAAPEVAGALLGERLFRHPVRLAAGQLLRHLSGDWQSALRLEGLDRVASVPSAHALLTGAEMAPVTHLVEAARHLAAIERRLAELPAPSLVTDLYPSHYAPVPGLISRAELACARGGVIGVDTTDGFRAGARRLLRAVDAELEAQADLGFPGCLRIWEVGDAVVAPLLDAHRRVAVLLVDAMRADLSSAVLALIASTLPGRPLHRQWAVVPSPTRTAEAVAALSLGRPVPAGSASARPGPADVPFSHLGYEAVALVGADRDDRGAELEALWRTGPPISVAVAVGVDERLHRTSVELAALLDEATAALDRRVVPSLAALPAGVPLVVLADHGFRENPHWGHGPEGRYVHGGTSLEECVVPVAVFHPANGPGGAGAAPGPAAGRP